MSEYWLQGCIFVIKKLVGDHLRTNVGSYIGFFQKRVKMQKNMSIIVTVSVFSLAITLIDAWVQPNYFIKIPIKVVFFLALPMLFFIKHKEDFRDFKKLFIFQKSGILKAFILAIGVYAIILSGYFLTENTIDYSGVTSGLTEGMGITAENFIYVSLYISLMIRRMQYEKTVDDDTCFKKSIWCSGQKRRAICFCSCSLI